MRSIRFFVVASLVAGGLSLALVTPAQATATAKTSRFCRDVANLDSQTAGLDPSMTDADAGRTATSLRKASKHAPRKVKKALRTMAGVYQRIADGDGVQSVLAEDAGKFVSATAKFSTYYVKHCLAVPVPTTLG